MTFTSVSGVPSVESTKPCSSTAPCRRRTSEAIQSRTRACPGVPGMRGPASTWKVTRRKARAPSTAKSPAAHAAPQEARASTIAHSRGGRMRSEGELGAQFETHGARHLADDEVAVLTEAELDVAGEIAAERIAALRVQGDPVARDLILRPLETLLQGLARLALVRARQAQVDVAAHRRLLAEDVHFLTLRVRAVDAEVEIRVAVRGHRASEQTVLGLCHAPLDPRQATRAVLQIAADLEQRLPLAARRDVRGLIAVDEVHRLRAAVRGLQ